jgi:hypothetical protein
MILSGHKMNIKFVLKMLPVQWFLWTFFSDFRFCWTSTLETRKFLKCFGGMLVVFIFWRVFWNKFDRLRTFICFLRAFGSGVVFEGALHWIWDLKLWKFVIEIFGDIQGRPEKSWFPQKTCWSKAGSLKNRKVWRTDYYFPIP